MSSYTQSSPAAERNEAVWRPMHHAKLHCKNFSSQQYAQQPNLPPKSDRIRYATMASRHSAKDKQALSYTSHLSSDLHSISDHQATNNLLSRASHSRKDLAVRNGDASLNTVTSSFENTEPYLKESNASKKPSVNLTKANFYLKKPPILSPKPNILPKPKIFSPNTVDEKNQSTGVEDLDRAFQSNSRRDLQPEARKFGENRFRGRSQSVEEETALHLSTETHKTAKANPSSGSHKVKRSQTLPRQINNDEYVREFGMETAKGYIDPPREKFSLKSPPKIPAKPKIKPIITSPSNRCANGKPITDKSLNQIDSDDPSLVPFSEMRSKFEDMKIKFKKPVPEPDFVPPPVKKSSSGPALAEDLFKDILEMKSLEHFEKTPSVTPAIHARENVEKNSSFKIEASGSSYPVDDWFLDKPKATNVTPPENLQNLKQTRISKFIDAPSSPKGRKFSQSELQPKQAGVSDRKYNPADIPAPIKVKNDDLHEINFMDLPPPPELPPNYEPHMTSISKKSGDAKPSATQHIERNLTTHEKAVYHHKDRQQIASGSTQLSMHSNKTMGSRSENKSSNNNHQNSKLLGKPVKAENPSNQWQSSESNRHKAVFSHNAPSLGDHSSSLNGTFAQPSVSEENALKDTKFPIAPPTRSFEEEILYYDNMDIMEKVRQKREQDEFRLKKFSEHQDKNVSLPKKNKDRINKENKEPVPQNLSYSYKPPINKISASSPSAKVSLKNGSTNLQNKVANFEKEGLKEEKQSQAPPKLPPKQHKFNRKQAVKNAEDQKSPTSDKQHHLSTGSKESSHQPLRIQIGTSPTQTISPHIATPIPTQASPSFISLSQTQQQNSMRQQQPQGQLPPQITPEDARARQLVDEPLAPIIEEDSTYGDSSSCASSVTGDDGSVFETSSVRSFDLQSTSSSLTMLGFPQTKALLQIKDEQDGGTTETDSTFAEKESLGSSSSYEDESDAPSVQWQENPLQNKPVPAGSSPDVVSGPPITAAKVSVSTPQRSQIEVEKEGRNVHATPSSIQLPRESKSSESSGPKAKDTESAKQIFSQSSEELGDVAPYGMVDLSKLEPNYETNSRLSSSSTDAKLTPSSIMHSVSQFNATHSKSPTKSTGSFGFDESTEMPTFPLKVDVVGKKQLKSSKTPPTRHQRSKSDAERRFDEEEQPGYDNLENYGGATREAEMKKKMRETSLPAKYTQPPTSSPTSESSPQKPMGRENSRDSLASEPGLARQVAGSRASFPLPAAESRLARHSSAVRAVDRHSGNLKRAKESGAFESFHKSPGRRREDTKSPSSTFPLSHENVVKNKVVKQDCFSGSSYLQTKKLHSQNEFPNQNVQVTGQKYKIDVELPSDFDEQQDDAIANPYEEVPFVSPSKGQKEMPLPLESDQQTETKSRVKEIMENVKAPDSPYKPKPPVPRYPVDYDNFYLGKDTSTPKTNTSSAKDATSKRNLSSPNSYTPITTPIADDKSFSYSDVSVTPSSTPALSRAAASRTSRSNKSDMESNVSIPSQDEDTLHNASDAGSRSLGSQLRYLLGGGQDSKHASPSIRRKRSLLKRSKSPGGSRRSKSPSKSIETGDEHSSCSGGAIKPTRDILNDEHETSKNESSKSSETESRDQAPPRRSASQRLVDRRGRAAPQRPKTSEDESSGQTLERRKKDKLRMSSRWRRSKSQDRAESPARSKSKERKIFGRRSKSQERPGDKDSKELDTGDEERSGRKFLRRSRSSSRKRDKRGRSSERTDDGNSSGGRGRNPVKFFRKLLRNKKSDDDIEIIHSTFDKAGDLTDSSEALSTILAYKGEDGVEKEGWNPPRPNPPQQRVTNLNDKKSKPSPSTKPNKALKSPPSHRAKKFSSSHSTKTRPELSTGSSSEGVDKRKQDRNKATPTLGNFGSSRSRLSPPQKPTRTSSRKSSFSNSLPSSDSEPFNKSDSKRRAFANPALASNRNQFPLTSAGLRRNLLNREYDSDTATSVLVSDADSSAGPHSDFDTNNYTGLRPVLKPGNAGHQFHSKDAVAPKRPVRVISPQRSKSDPSIFPGPSTFETNPSNTYYNIEEDSKSQTAVSSTDKKRPDKSVASRRRNQKQTRRQTAPVDLAYEAHQRQKYKTLVSLNSQTLRKVTEKWLSEWRNQLPVGGFLITSWSDVALSSHRPMCMIANSVVYSAVSTGSKQFHLACQLYDHADVDDRMLRKLDNCSSLPAHPNTCGVCSHFNCRVPRSLLDPSSGGGAADAVCVVLTTRPYQSLQDFLDRVARQEDPTELHRQVLVNILQLLQGVKHLQASGFDLSQVSVEHLVITEDRGFLQILPHLYCSDSRGRRNVGRDSCQSSDSDSNFPPHLRSVTQQVGNLTKILLQNGSLASSVSPLSRPGERRSTTSNVVLPGTKYSAAFKHIIRHLETTPTLSVQDASQIIQCALWGPEDLEDVGVDDVSPYAALELWIEMEQAKLVNSLAVLASNDRLVPFSFLKHQYFASVTPQFLFNGLKVLQRI